MSLVRQVFWYAMGTAIATGFGAIPFVFLKKINDKVIGRTNAVAAGLMMGATYGLLETGFQDNRPMTMVGVVVGAFLIWMIKYGLDLLERKKSISLDSHVLGSALGFGRHVSFKHVLLIIIVMTIHSCAEGLGIGASFGGSMAFGVTIAFAIAIHNIPEGLAISAALVGKGEKRRKAGLRSIFTSLPQPLFAVPVYMFVVHFKPYIPLGLGFAAGAMLWLAFADIIPDAQKNIPHDTSASIITIAIMLMIAFQFLLTV